MHLMLQWWTIISDQCGEPFRGFRSYRRNFGGGLGVFARVHVDAQLRCEVNGCQRDVRISHSDLTEDRRGRRSRCDARVPAM